MSSIQVSAQEMSSLYTTVYCVYAACAVLIYDWLLCLGEEVKFIWNGHARLTGSALVYACSRYMLLIQTLLAAVTNYSMSDLSCRAVGWMQTITGIVGAIAFSAFSGLRTYALSNRNIWLAAVTVFLALPPTAIRVVQSVYTEFVNQPSPFNCGVGNSLSPTLSISITLITRASQLAAELLVVVVTWWYTFQSYRIHKNGINIGKSISSLLVYNGSIYFLFLASLYTLDIIFNTASVSPKVSFGDSHLVLFYDPITSILVCHFMLSLRQFDRGIYSGAETQAQDHTTSSGVLQFAAQPSETLPAFIASFAQPVHVDDSASEVDALGSDCSS